MTDLTDEVAYELALLQFCPDVAADERLNIGVLAFSPANGAVAFRFSERYGRLKAAFPALNGTAYRGLIRSLHARARAVQAVGPDGLQKSLETTDSIESILSIILPNDSANFGWSTIRFGVCGSLQEIVNLSFTEFIVNKEKSGRKVRRDHDALWDAVSQSEAFEAISKRLGSDVRIATKDYAYSFRGSWHNGTLNVVEPISLDYADPGSILEEATIWRGRIAELRSENDFVMTAIVSDPPDDSARRQYEQADHILAKAGVRRFPESRIQDFVDVVMRDLQQHVEAGRSSVGSN